MNDPSKRIAILGLNWADEKGARFNGLDIVKELNQNEVDYTLAVGVTHTSKSEHVIDAFSFRKVQLVRRIAARLEAKSGFQSRLHFWSNQIRNLKAYKEADLIHVHIIHNDWFRLETLRSIAKEKPILWTIHDYWIVTGHCVMPFQCQRFRTGCGACPDLTLPLAVGRDRTDNEVKRKNRLIRDLKAEYHFSTNWFYDQIRNAFPARPENSHVIPFGIDTSFYESSKEMRDEFRKRYLIPKDEVVFLIRASGSPQKGTKVAISALKRLKRKVTIITLDENNQFRELINQHNIIEFGWVDDPILVKRIYSSVDFLLMPSLQETFGVMSLEAMSFGVPVIYAKETAVHEVVQAEFPFSYDNAYSANSLLKSIETVIEDPGIKVSESNRIRNRAVTHFSSELYSKNLANLYRETIRRWNE
jgi:glycosyltransferase involved in cell wall biosynthesis